VFTSGVKAITGSFRLMAIEARLRELGVKHQTLDRAIQDETSRPAADAVKVRELKRQKLRLKEEMETLRSRLH
jgi:hypothetical protein